MERTSTRVYQATAAAALAALGCLTLLAGAARANDATIVGKERVSDRVLELTIDTPAFAEPTKIHVNLPPGYGDNRSRRWPVTYFTAGTSQRYSAFNGIGEGEELTQDYPSLVVSPDANSGYWSDWFNAGAFGPPMYETYVIDQLIPLIDERFRTVPRRSHRAIFGVSMGGYGALMLAARHPGLFAAASSLSGTVDTNLAPNAGVLSISSTFDGGAVDAIYGPRAEQEVRWRGHNPWDLAENLRGLDLQVRTANGVPNPGIGETDPTALASCVIEGGVFLASTSLHNELERLGVPHTWRNYGPGCHTPMSFKRQAVDTLEVFESVLANPANRMGRPARFTHRSIEPRFEVRGWTVRADAERALEFMELEDAGRSGFALTGSGTTLVKTPAFFRKLGAVDVIGPAGTETLAPSRRGRLSLSVGLGPPHLNQQYTPASRVAGSEEPGYFQTAGYSFEPHARLVLRPAGLRDAGSRACVRARGADVRKVRIEVSGAGASSRAFSVKAGQRKCPRVLGLDRDARGRMKVVARGRDQYGHRVRAARSLRRP